MSQLPFQRKIILVIKQSLLIMLLFGFALNVKSQKSIERKQLLDDNWKFYLGDALMAKSLDFDDKSWRNINLPHDWSIEGKINLKNPMGGDGGFFPSGIGWYRKKISIPALWKGKQIKIYFEGVYMNSEVFINGKSLGIYPYGYTAFEYDLTPYLNFDKENIISVKVDNDKQKNSRWYSGSGIYRHVWLMVTDPVYIPNWGVSITTPKVSSDRATVQVKTKIRNQTNSPESVIVKTELYSVDDKNNRANQLKVIVLANSEKEIIQNIIITKPALWSTEMPNLYQARVKILKNEKVIDVVNNEFGIRSIKYSTENGFELNGKTIKLNGGCIHHDNGCLGAAAFDDAEDRKVKLLKSAGFNAIRTAHNPPSEALLTACDRLGMLVIDEAFDGWREAKNKFDYSIYFDKWWQKDLGAMVLRDQNHPSIIMWSIGNEIIERKKNEAISTAKMLASYVRKLDPTRPITSAMTTWDKDWDIFDPLMAVHDIGGYNYQLHRAVDDHKRVPSRIILQTESYPNDAFANWKLVNDNSYIIGDFVWTALDYLGESGIGRWYQSGEATNFHGTNELFPWHGAYCGDVDLIGWRKPISHYRNMLYNDTEKLYMAVREPNPEPIEIKTTAWGVWPTWESWTWPGYEGKELVVEVYSKYPKVRLYLNKKIIGEQLTTINEQFKAMFSVPYTEGELRAVGLLDDKEVENVILKTAGDAKKIRLIPNRNIISPNGQDLVFINIEVIDKNGVIQANAENKLEFKIVGAGSIAGIDNANLKDVDTYVGSSRKAWKGKALVVIRSSKKPGDIQLKVSSPGLEDGLLVIKSK